MLARRNLILTSKQPADKLCRWDRRMAVDVGFLLGAAWESGLHDLCVKPRLRLVSVADLALSASDWCGVGCYVETLRRSNESYLRGSNCEGTRSSVWRKRSCLSTRGRDSCHYPAMFMWALNSCHPVEYLAFIRCDSFRLFLRTTGT